MSEIRQDRATKRWVVLATERAKRPHDAVKRSEAAPEPEYSPDCPFCPGNEDKTPAEVLALRSPGSEPNGPGWQVRVFANRFAALRPEGEVRVENPEWFTSITGVGIHDVIVEHPHHNETPATMTLGEMLLVFEVLSQRFAQLAGDRRLAYLALFRNQGVTAGSSLHHPHAQLIGTPIVPTHVRQELTTAREFYDDAVCCVYCATMQHELADGRRVVLDNDHYCAFTPYASRWPFETWIVPKHHEPVVVFDDRFDTESFARTLQSVLRMLYLGAGNPDYNLVLHQAPLRDSCEDYYHWHMEIVPRLSTPAGFEFGTGIWINTVMPEEAAPYLRSFAGQ